MIRNKLSNINSKIEKTALACGRSASDIVLVCVTKEAGIDEAEEAIKSGITDIGENRVRDAEEKYSRLSGAQAVRWHFIGHLQTNKVKKAVQLFDLIHSVDSLHLAERIQIEAEKLNKAQSILVQVNVSGEGSKFGISPDGVRGLVGSIAGMKNIMLLGLMTLAPYSDDPEDSRPHFRKLKELLGDLKPYNRDNINMKHLSMGMSGDFEVAIEEGADIVRIGSAIFK
ncbi:MAG: YggS family pyridoxal phosphate-dependent enzyme [Candidatus Omnitrophica bacterium]|nr:YggS family pyridoxal phosphate-dependent enzyme [Candidatus Omnitrophota bacterium]